MTTKPVSTNTNCNPEQAAYIRSRLVRLGEPPSSVEYLLRTVYFNGEPVTVQAPNGPATDTGD